MSNFISIANITTIGDGFRCNGGVKSLNVSTAVSGKVGACRIVLEDPLSEIGDVASIDEAFSFSWIFNGTEEQGLFSGRIVEVSKPNRQQLSITALDRFNDLLTEKLTITLERQPPSEMVKELVGGCLQLPLGEIEDLDTELDKLPLYKMTAAQALRAINQRMKLEHDFYFNEAGEFVWSSRDYKQEPAGLFEFGVNIFDFDLTNRSLVTWACPISLGQTIQYTDHNGEIFKLFVTGLHHSILKRGSRTEINFEVIEDE